MKTYSVSEAAEIVGIKERAVQYRCKRDNVRKKDNRYLITDEIISLWRDKEAEANAIKRKDKRNNATQSNNFAQLDLEVEALKSENESLKAKVKEYENNTQLNLKQAIELITIEAAKQDVTHKIFTNEEFEEIIGTMALSESQIKEINYLRNRIEKQDEILMSLAKSIQERNLIEAVEKDIIDKNTHKPKKPL